MGPNQCAFERHSSPWKYSKWRTSRGVMPLINELARPMATAFWLWIMAWWRLLESTFCMSLFCGRGFPVWMASVVTTTAEMPGSSQYLTKSYSFSVLADINVSFRSFSKQMVIFSTPRRSIERSNPPLADETWMICPAPSFIFTGLSGRLRRHSAA
jgi:hypothetical protein